MVAVRFCWLVPLCLVVSNATADAGADAIANRRHTSHSTAYDGAYVIADGRQASQSTSDTRADVTADVWRRVDWG